MQGTVFVPNVLLSLMCYQILPYKPSSTAMSNLPSGDKLILEIFSWFSKGRVHDLLLIEQKEHKNYNILCKPEASIY